MNYFRRLRQPDGEDEGRTPSSAEAVESSIKKFDAYSLGSTPGAETPRQDESQPETTAVSDGGDERTPGPEDAVAYEQVGEHVTAVLSSAHEAASRLRASATEEAEQIRAEAEAYAAKSRAAADAYSDEQREAAETKASAIVSEAEKRARSVRDAAQKDAVDTQREAVERRKALLEESERAEERLRNVLQVFRAMTERLENLVGETAKPRDVDARGNAAAEGTDGDLAEALMLDPRSNDSPSRRPSARS